jgi:hypothetical protein
MAVRPLSVLVITQAALLGLALLVACRAPAKPQPTPCTSPATPRSESSMMIGSAGSIAQPHSGSNQFPSPELDLPAERLHEHVDGAEPALKALGCRRLLFWRLSNPSVELEIFVFNTESGARAALDKDSGAARSKDVPGDEGWTNQQVVYFRRGTAYCRLIADQPPPVAGLSGQANRVNKALDSGAIRP